QLPLRRDVRRLDRDLVPIAVVIDAADQTKSSIQFVSRFQSRVVFEYVQYISHRLTQSIIGVLRAGAAGELQFEVAPATGIAQVHRVEPDPRIELSLQLRIGIRSIHQYR